MHGCEGQTGEETDRQKGNRQTGKSSGMETHTHTLGHDPADVSPEDDRQMRCGCFVCLLTVGETCCWSEMSFPCVCIHSQVKNKLSSCPEAGALTGRFKKKKRVEKVKIKG